MQIFKCDACGCDVEMPDDYERPMCCSGYMCGCRGLPTEPILCDACDEKYFRPAVDGPLSSPFD